jgi:hypothetical protein
MNDWSGLVDSPSFPLLATKPKNRLQDVRQHIQTETAINLKLHVKIQGIVRRESGKKKPQGFQSTGREEGRGRASRNI